MLKKNPATRHSVFLNPEHEAVLSEIVDLKKLNGIKTVSKCICFIILDYYKMLTEATEKQEVKLNEMSKQVGIIENLVCLLVCEIPDEVSIKKEETSHYQRAVKEVEAKLGNKPSTLLESEAAIRVKPIDSNYLKQVAIKKNNDELEKMLESIN